MSSLRLALKQSLQETGHLAPKEKKKKKSAPRRGRQPRQPGEPPRKRGRPPKHSRPPVAEPPKEDRDNDDKEEDEDGSENEFSYDSEASHEEHEDQEGEEDENEDEEEDKEQTHNRSRHSEQEGDDKNGDPDDNEEANEYRGRKKNKKLSSKQQEEINASDEERQTQRKILKKELKHSAANKIQIHWKKKRAASVDERKAKKGEESQEMEANSSSHQVAEKQLKRGSPTKEKISTTQTLGKKKKEKGQGNSSPVNSKSSTVPPPTPEVLEWARNISERKCRKHITSGMRVKVRFATKVKREGKVIKKKIWYGGKVSAVSKEGSKIRIKYDDGTSEVSQFPDKDVVVDETDNGQHSVPADKFIPPSIKEEEMEPEEEEYIDPNTDEHPGGAQEKQAAQKMPDEEMGMVIDEDRDRRQKTDKGASTPVKPTLEATPQEEKLVASTPPSKETSGVENLSPRLRDFGSPEEGELSPGLVLKKKDSSKSIAAPQTQNELLPNAVQENLEKEMSLDSPRVELTKDIDTSTSKHESTGKPAAPASKPSLTIRISNIKQQEETEPANLTSKKNVETSDEELYADTPVTQRKVKSIDLEKIDSAKEKPSSRKRLASDGSAEEPPSKKRIYLKNDRPVVAVSQEGREESRKSDKEDELQEASVVGDRPSEVESQTLSSLGKVQHEEETTKKDSKTTISLTLRGPISGETEEDLAPPSSKMNRSNDSAGSPSSKGRRSPINERHLPEARSESSTAMSKTVDVAEGANTISESLSMNADIGSSEMAATTPELSVVDSTISLFSSEQPGNAAIESKHESRVQALESEEQVETEESKSKVSTESIPSNRTGRRAAQQAKEKLNSKQEGAGPESAKKKKKRRRREGKESDGDESDQESDENNWVQCDACGKWRILPSSVKASSLPDAWYCHLNIYDPKRNNCSALEQTPKQVAKERRRAKKRARKQRLEQAELEAAAEDAKKGSGKEDRPSTPTSSPKPTKGVVSPKTGKGTLSPKPARGALGRKTASASEAQKRLSPVPKEFNTQDSGSDSLPRLEKKGKKGKSEDTSEGPAVDKEPEQPKGKPGRKRGRPARNRDVQEKKDDDNVEWVQCEKCEKWRKLPPHISAEELPDVWYCTMNTWNPESASCESPEDKADASHQEVGSFVGLTQGNPGKYSYRSMIFGTVRKHNRPLSERSRAAESLFMRPLDEEENPYPTVMYSKSSAFMPKISNFTKSNNVEERATSIFDVLSNSDLWTELRGLGAPMPVLSAGNQFQGQPKFLTFENLPDNIKEAMREIVLYTLGSSTLSGDDIIGEAQRFPWESLSKELVEIHAYLNADVIINTILSLVRDGLVEMTCLRDPSLPISQWIPKYRKVRSRRDPEAFEAMKSTRFMKIAKPWKQREGNSADWITGGAAFA